MSCSNENWGWEQLLAMLAILILIIVIILAVFVKSPYEKKPGKANQLAKKTVC